MATRRWKGAMAMAGEKYTPRSYGLIARRTCKMWHMARDMVGIGQARRCLRGQVWREASRARRGTGEARHRQGANRVGELQRALLRDVRILPRVEGGGVPIERRGGPVISGRSQGALPQPLADGLVVGLRTPRERGLRRVECGVQFAMCAVRRANLREIKREIEDQRVLLQRREVDDLVATDELNEIHVIVRRVQRSAFEEFGMRKAMAVL